MSVETTLAMAIEGALGAEDETVRAWTSEAVRLEVLLDEAITLLAAWQAGKPDERHTREFLNAASYNLPLPTSPR